MNYYCVCNIPEASRVKGKMILDAKCSMSMRIEDNLHNERDIARVRPSRQFQASIVMENRDIDSS